MNRASRYIDASCEVRGHHSDFVKYLVCVFCVIGRVVSDVSKHRSSINLQDQVVMSSNFQYFDAIRVTRDIHIRETLSC
jgi:hypothetical protein